MGGGGNFFSQIGKAITSIVSDPSPPTPQKSMDRISKAFGGDNSNSGNSATDGGTPTTNLSSATKQAGSAAAVSQSNQAANASAGSGTMLTGNQGVDPNSLELGRKSLLGG